MPPKLSLEVFEEMYHKWLEARAAPCARCERMGRNCTASTRRTFKYLNGATLPSGLVFPAQAPDWWAERVRVYELEHRLDHVAPGTNSPQKSRPAQMRKTRSTSSKKTTSNREGKKKAATSPSSASPAAESPRPGTGAVLQPSVADADPPRPSTDAVLERSARSVTRALQDPRLPRENQMAVADGNLEGSRNIPAIRVKEVDPTSLSQQVIKRRLETLERQRVHYLRQYSRSTRRAHDISNELNECFGGDGAHFDRDSAIIALHCAQESLVAARVDGGYLAIVSCDIARFRAALGNDAFDQSADEEEEVADEIAREELPAEAPTGEVERAVVAVHDGIIGG
ncbi:hypothetical protein C8Q78DRAFT_992899 [Trametes maxima]|nr:hypothetical protein C8Q78DRAFT_992899 [Trametes maxima]